MATKNDDEENENENACNCLSYFTDLEFPFQSINFSICRPSAIIASHINCFPWERKSRSR